jgi:hypothetical protein
MAELYSTLCSVHPNTWNCKEGYGMIQQVALVSEVGTLSFGQVARVSAALQKQAVRDLSQFWDIQATVDAFEHLEDVPLGYWPIIIIEDVAGAAGIHLDKDGQPFALVEAGPSWSLTASHECLEMLVDPFGNRLLAGQSLHPDQGRVEYLVEVCDPSEDAAFAYRVNNVLVSDFYLPSYFDPIEAPGVRYSFTGAIKKPRQVLQGGYLSWHDPMSDHWWQQTFFSGSEAVFRDLGVLARDGQSIRSILYSLTPEPRRLSHIEENTAIMRATLTAASQAEESTSTKARGLRTQIEALKKRQHRK